MKLLSWNLSGKTGPAAEEQLAEVLKAEPDAVALQEVVPGSLETWAQGLLAHGYTVVSSIELLAVPGPQHEKKPRRIRRKNFNLTASRFPLAVLPGLAFREAGVRDRAFPEKYLVTRIRAKPGTFDLHNAHLPPGSTRGIVKVETFEAIRKRLDEPTPVPRVLCGDFNTPWEESDEGIKTAAHRHPGERQRWDEAERMILEHPELSDLYRANRSPGDDFAVSHYRGRGDRRVGCRYEHVYVSAEFDLRSSRVEYLEPLLDRGLSDHAPVAATLALS